MTRILIIGDPHAHPGYDNDRFEHIGAFARQREVDHIHCVGDWTDFPSLNMHKSMQDARKGDTDKDIEAGNDALLRFDEGLDGYHCSMTISLGNHDEYPEQYVATQAPELSGILKHTNVKHKQHGWKPSRFKESKRVRGILTSHFFGSKGTGRPIGGVHAAYRNGIAQSETCVVGHSHLFDHKAITYAMGRTTHSFVAGCMVHPSYIEGWCRGTVHYWQRGLLIVEMIRGRVARFEWVTYEQVKKELGT